MSVVFLESIGLCGPALANWQSGQSTLRESSLYTFAGTRIPDVELLPPAERRRAALSVRLALAVAQEAVQFAHCDASHLSTTFTSSAGDSGTLHAILEILATAERQVSPTRFHNSVHNAPAGYWHIATKNQESSASISCHDDSFAAGLLDCATRIALEGSRGLLVAYDLPYPPPLHARRTIPYAYAVALVLSPVQTSCSLAAMHIEITRNSHPHSILENPEMEQLRRSNPAARSLPILIMLARGEWGTVYLPFGNRNAVAVSLASLR